MAWPFWAGPILLFLVAATLLVNGFGVGHLVAWASMLWMYFAARRARALRLQREQEETFQ